MFGKVLFSQNPYKVLDDALSRIPAIREGKGDTAALVSFIKDIEMYRRFRAEYLLEDSKFKKKLALEAWNEFVELREAEDFIPHNDSKNYHTYQTMFY